MTRRCGSGPPTTAPARIITLPAPLNGVVVAPDGEIAVAAADGRLRLFGPDGEARGEIVIGETPLIALALSADGAHDRRRRAARAGRPDRPQDAQQSGRRWSGPACRSGRWRSCLMAGSCCRAGPTGWCGAGTRVTGEHVGPVVPRAGQDVLAGLAGERGAQVFRACAACHTLTPADGNRAGPTLHGLFGRRIASAPGYAYSEALKGMDIVWTKETVAKLFEIGPNAYTPGTKMPEQTIGTEEDRQALVDWLEKVTR